MESLSYHNGEHYSSSYSIFKKNIVGDLTRMLLHNLPPVVQSILDANQDLDQFNILSIGSGDGTEDIKVVKIIEEEVQRSEKYRNLKIFVRAVEPNQCYTTFYRKAIEDLSRSLKVRSAFEVRGYSFEEYMGQNDGLRFDLVIFNHSMYYLDVEQSLIYCLDKELKDNGKIVVTLDESGPLSGVNFAEDEADIDGSSVEKVSQAIDKNKWRLSDFRGEYELDLTDVFDENSQEGNLLLDFIIQQVNFRATAKEEQIDLVMKVLQEKSTLKNGKRFGKTVDRMFVISR